MANDLRISAERVAIALPKRLRRQVATLIHRIPRWVWWSAAAVIALHIYFFQELLAAYLIFSVLFVSLVLLMFVFYLLSEIGDYGMRWIEADARAIMKKARQQWVHTEALLHHQIHSRNRAHSIHRI